MKTKDDFIAECKTANPKMVQTVNGVSRELTSEEYEEACSKWADMQLEKIAYQQELDKIAQTKSALLEKLGISEDEARLLLS